MGFFSRLFRRGQRRRVAAVAVDGDAEILPLTQFAPGHENLTIRFTFRRGTRRLRRARMSLEITDKDNTQVFFTQDADLFADDHPDRRNPQEVEWDGEDTDGNLVTPQKSPYTVTLKIGDIITRQREVKVVVDSIELDLGLANDPEDAMIMNNPNELLVCLATVNLKMSRGNRRKIKTPIKVHWSFDANPDNAEKDDSFEYADDQRLARGGDDDAVFWERHNAHPDDPEHVGSDDEYKETCWVRTIVSEDRLGGRAVICFKPSGYGGDKYRIRAVIKAEDSGAISPFLGPVLVANLSNWFAVYRKVEMVGREMPSHRLISESGSEEEMDDFFTPETYVKYALTMGDDLDDVVYYGLWNHDDSDYRDWDEWQQKVADEDDDDVNEVPDDDDWETAQGGDGISEADRDAARERIRVLAQRWADRIYQGWRDAVGHWPTDKDIDEDTILGVGSEHPKTSSNAPSADAVTDEWHHAETQVWLRVTVGDEQKHPDDRWKRVLGVTRARRVYIFDDDDEDEQKKTVAHESAHQTKTQFKRALFRPVSVAGPAADNDHSNVAGLMDPTGSAANFTQAEKNILRGSDNP